MICIANYQKKKTKSQETVNLFEIMQIYSIKITMNESTIKGRHELI